MAAPYDAVLGRSIVIRDHAVERTVTAAEAFLLHMTNAGLNGDGHAARSTMSALEISNAGSRSQAAAARQDIGQIYTRLRERTRKYGPSDDVSELMCRMKMATKIDRYRPTTRTLIEPWLVEAALARLGNRQLNADEQRVVVDATRSPARVHWPDWWEVVPDRSTRTRS